ncbi:MAG TPA: hypothetical protein VFS12_12525, partial [Terriglobia bacterium]|nr:hypothetical protein [Terriglobia bacterium]
MASDAAGCLRGADILVCQSGRLSSRPRPDWKVRRTSRLECLTLEISRFRSGIRALFGVRWQSAGRSRAATALWLRSTTALDEVSCLTVQSKAASRVGPPSLACRRSPKDDSDSMTRFVYPKP